MSPKYDFVIITPCYNENITIIKFLDQLEKDISNLDYTFLVLIVDDASTDDSLHKLKSYSFRSEKLTKKLISLKFNSGHQHAIYQGLLYAKDIDADRIIVMDSDGEDDSACIRDLCQIRDAEIVFVSRGKRRENLKFRAGYMLYQLLFWLITKKKITFGNYSMVSREVLEVAVHKNFVHYASFLSRLNVSTKYITYDRKNRIDGKSKMNFTRLVIHGFSSLIEYSQEILVIFLKIFFLIALLVFLVFIMILYIKLFTNEAIPGWTSILLTILLNLAALCIGFFIIGLMQLKFNVNAAQARMKLYEEIS